MATIRDTYSNLNTRQKLLFIIGFYCLVNIPGFWVPYYNVDEATNALYGMMVYHGDIGIQYFVGNPYFLTHLVYTAFYFLFKSHCVLAIHLLHIIWKCLTIISIYWCTKELLYTKEGKEKAALWGAAFYALSSMSFFSKDFQFAGAESFSLLPATLSVALLFRAYRTGRFGWQLPTSAALASIATLFKTPIGLIIIALNIFILLNRKKWFLRSLVYDLIFFALLLSPLLLFPTVSDGIDWVVSRSENNAFYINFYDSLSLIYSVLKYLLRSLAVFATLMVFSYYLVGGMASFKKIKESAIACRLITVILWFVFAWFVAFLGKRVFFHYFVFMLAPGAVLAGVGKSMFRQNKYLAKAEWALLFIPFVVFTLDGALNYSTFPPRLTHLSEFIVKNTDKDDRIFVWGAIPQIYFMSERLPASTFFWAEALAGTNPGSPAMEYMRATGKKIATEDMLMMDFNPKPFGEINQETKFRLRDDTNEFSEKELLSWKDLYPLVDDNHWREVFTDFEKHPPQLIVDSSNTNIRGFSYYPIIKYDLLQCFMEEKYSRLTSVDGFEIYRLKTSRP